MYIFIEYSQVFWNVWKYLEIFKEVCLIYLTHVQLDIKSQKSNMINIETKVSNKTTLIYRHRGMDDIQITSHDYLTIIIQPTSLCKPPMEIFSLLLHDLHF